MLFDDHAHGSTRQFAQAALLSTRAGMRQWVLGQCISLTSNISVVAAVMAMCAFPLFQFLFARGFLLLFVFQVVEQPVFRAPAPYTTSTNSSSNRMFSHQSRSDKSKNKKARAKLSIDTTCAVQNQVFPYESRVPELKFISFSESQARKAASKVQAEGKTPVHPGAEQSVSGLQPNISVRSQRGAIVLLGRKPEPLNQNLADVPSGYGATPTIVLTPARDGFRSTQALQVKGKRPASSVYSRYTNCMITSAAPPVPPLPFTTHTAAGLKSRFSTVTDTTAFEEDDSPVESPQTSRSFPRFREAGLAGSETPGLPTPRRSKGWWNVLSPFSARSSRPAFWRSPSPVSGCTPVLQNAAAMGHADSHRSVGIAAESGDEVLRSAPASIMSQQSVLEPGAEKPLRRSSTAPAVLDTATQAFDTYQIASTGLAAAYFDVAQRYPSLHAQESDRDWSPSQSVYLPARDSSTTHAGSMEMLTVREVAVDLGRADRGHVCETENSHIVDHDSSPPPQQSKAARTAFFSTPSEDELRTPVVPRSKPIRAMTQTTNTTMMSPLSATPEVQQAHLGMPVGPDSSFGEQKQIAVSRAPTPTALDEKTASYTQTAHDTAQELPYPASVTRLRPTHKRQESYGLGITDGKRDLFPPPTYVEEKPRLGTDRYGQLKVIIAQAQKPSRPWYRRHFWLLAFLYGALLVLLVVMLAVLIPQRHHDAQVQTTWLNLTGLPAMAIGVNTIIQPRKTASRDTCTQQSLWTCAAPTEASRAALPDFRLEIRFRNGTLPRNETAAKNDKRDAWQEYVYTASPSVPSTNDQLYLGRTTDNTSAPYDGEETPFYISIIAPVALAIDSTIRKRSSNFSYVYPTTANDVATTTQTSAAASTIPNAAIKSSGKPDDSILYPYVTAQPLRLYDRDQDTEHYGFYTYFDRSVYVSNPSSPLLGNSSTGVVTNVALQDASAVCTFSETRMLMQIWTRQGTIANLTTSNKDTDKIEAKSSSAKDMTAPGSFPYPVTFTLDRHGGQAEKKGVHCYALDEQHKVDSIDKGWVMEYRGVGGMLVDAAIVPGSTTQEKRQSKRDDEDVQGVDGGSGGCVCQWESSGE